MPPKKKPVKASADPKTPVKRRSKLAQENDITAEDEAEIKEAWAICREDEVAGYEDEKAGVIPTSKVDVVMRALGIQAKSAGEAAEFRSILDPESDGYVTYPHFVELCAIQINNKTDESKAEEVERAFKLFTRGINRNITIYDLKQTATILKEDIGDDVLKAMILEANGGAGVGQGVNVEQFREILTKANVFT